MNDVGTEGTVPAPAESHFLSHEKIEEVVCEGGMLLMVVDACEETS